MKCARTRGGTCSRLALSRPRRWLHWSVCGATNPRYLSIFDSPVGQMVLIGCAASVALGYMAMLYLTRLPGQRRVLVR